MMTMGAEQVLPQRAEWGRLAARTSIWSGITGALANALLVAFAVLAFVRPGAVQAMLWPIAGVSAGVSAVLLVPVALVLGGAGIVPLGLASMGFSALAWLLLAAGVLPPAVGASLLAGAGLGLSAWLFLVCRRSIVPSRSAKVGRRAGAAAFVGTLVLVVAEPLLPAHSTSWYLALLLGGVPAALGWFCVPAWSLRLGRWLRAAYGAA